MSIDVNQTIVRARADQLFRQHQNEIYRATDALFARLMIAQWLVGIAAAFWLTPFTWDGQTAAIHMHVWAAVVFGGIITVFPVAMTRLWPGATVTRHVIAVAQMLMSALLISLSGGRIETHFHIFGTLVILSFYRDWRVLIPATIVVGLDHFLRGIYWPYSVYGVLTASGWRSIEHAGWVLFEDVFLVISCCRSIREMRAIATRTAELEQDVAQRKRAEEALHDTNRQLETALQRNQLMMDNSQDVICTIDENGRFLSVNPACQSLWGYTPQELIGRSHVDFVCPDDRKKTAEADEEIRKNGKLTDFVNRYIRKDGALVDVLWSASWSQAEKIFFCVAHDVTARQRVERGLRESKDAADMANRAKSEFLSRMSHELRTPLNAILGFGQLLQRQCASDSQKDRVGHILAAGRHLLDLINEVLDISRIESGRIQLSLEPVPLGNILKETIDLIRPLAAERKIELSEPDSISPKWHVLADRQRLKQVLLNLLSNAVKYTQPGGMVTISAADLGSEKMRIVVSDNGPGIAPNNLSRLFTPFDRLGAEQSSVQGTGLGLALSQRLMQAMNGRIGAESDLGRGSTFWIELARASSPLQSLRTKTPTLPIQSAESIALAKTTVLYIEDNLSNLALVEQIVADQPNINLITAIQGNLGLDLARQHLPDLILLDLHLPDMPGWEVLSHLKAAPETSAIPTIVLSADATPGQIKRLREAGAGDYLTKPIDIDRFVEALEKAATTRELGCESPHQ